MGGEQAQRVWLNAPDSTSTVRVRMIDTTAVMLGYSSLFVDPPDTETMSMPDVAFLVEHSTSDEKALFDLGTRKDYWKNPPRTRKSIAAVMIGLRVDSDVPEILQANDIKLNEINDIIWSHAHWDHTGDPSLFPSTTTLNFGPDLSADLLPGYPENESSRHSSAYFANRKRNEIHFDSDLTIGGFRAHDFYKDGSFYLLETPGHAKGHICALARVTAPAPATDGRSTFILLGGDVCHHCGDLRPNETYIFPHDRKDRLSRHPQFAGDTPTSTDDQETKRASKPWYTIPTDAKKSAYDFPSPQVAQETIDTLRTKFDEAANVFVAIAHDWSLISRVPSLNREPDRDMNDWYALGWKSTSLWDWSDDLESGKDKTRFGVGFWKEGKRYENMQALLDSIGETKV